MALEEPIQLSKLPESQEANHSSPSPPQGDRSNEDALDSLPHGQEFSLPPVDGGKDAYLFLAASFMIEALVWGFAFSFGVFQDYYSTHEPFASSSGTAIIGTCAMGIMYLTMPLLFMMIRIMPSSGRWAPGVGLLIMCAALALSSLSTSVTHLIVTQGVLYAIGGSLCYCPCIIYMDEWFVRRKGLAYGIMWSGTGLAGVVLPLVVAALLARYGIATTLRAFAVALFLLTAPLAAFIRPRLPRTAAATRRVYGAPSASLRLIWTRAFALHQVANILQGLGFFLPSLYLPSYARAALGAGSFTSALTVLLVNVASVFGCVAMGSLTDRVPATTCLFVSTAGAAVGTLLLWGLAESLPLLYVFCLVYGLFAGSFSSAWPGVMRDVADSYHSSSQGRSHNPVAVDGVMVFAFLAAGRGVGNVASGPLSELLIKGSPWRGQAAGGYGTGYGSLIVFTGVTALLGGATFLWKRIGWL